MSGAGWFGRKGKTEWLVESSTPFIIELRKNGRSVSAGTGLRFCQDKWPHLSWTQDANGAYHGVDMRSHLTPAHDPVNHPPHYTMGKHESIDVIEGWATPYHVGNAIKYIARAKHKGAEKLDLEKACWYLDRYLAYQATIPERLRSPRFVSHPLSGERFMVKRELSPCPEDVVDDWKLAGPVATALLCIATYLATNELAGVKKALACLREAIAELG